MFKSIKFIKSFVQYINMVNSHPILLPNFCEKINTNHDGLQRFAHRRRPSVSFKESLSYRHVCVKTIKYSTRKNFWITQMYVRQIKEITEKKKKKKQET